MAPRTKAELAEHDRSLRAAMESLDADDESPSSTRLTPESGDEDDDDLFGHEGRGESGYEMERLNGGRADNNSGDWRDLAEEHERNLEHAEEYKERKSYSKDEERRVVRKLDRKLVVFMALLYMLSFLDRSSKFTVLMIV